MQSPYRIRREVPSVDDVDAPADLLDDREPGPGAPAFPLADTFPLTQSSKLPLKPGAR
jgi:hypothetical protein